MRLAKLFIIMLLLLSIYSCTEEQSESDLPAFYEALTKADDDLLHTDLIKATTSVVLTAGDYRDSEERKQYISLDPYYVYVEDDYDSYIVFNDLDDNYYQASLHGNYEENKAYVARLIDQNQLDDLEVIIPDDLLSSTVYEFPEFEKKSNTTFYVQIPFHELVGYDYFSQFWSVYNMFGYENRTAVADAPTDVYFTFDQGFQMQISLSFKIDAPYTITGTINASLRITTQLKASNNPLIDIQDEAQFVLVDNYTFENAQELIVDEIFNIPVYPENYNGASYYKVYLEEGHYALETNMEDRYRISMYDEEGNEITIHETGIDLELFEYDLHPVWNISHAGYYYLFMYAAQTSGKTFLVKHLNYESYASESSIDISDGGTFEYTLEGTYDILRFIYSGNSPVEITIEYVDDATMIYAYNNSHSKWEVSSRYDRNNVGIVLSEFKEFYLMNVTNQPTSGTITISIRFID